MHRCGSGLCLLMTITFAIALTGCLGNSTPNSSTGGVQNVSLNPAANFSMDVGKSQVFTATATDANGRPVLGSTQFSVTIPPGASGPAPLSVASNGNACAGAWDAQVAICSPGTPGIALVTAVVNGVSSQPTTVYVHFHVDSLQIMPAQQTQPPFDCFSQDQTWLYQGSAYSNNLDITTSVGPLNWAVTNAAVLKTANLFPNMPLNQVQITASTPGVTQLYASVSGTNSNVLPITTCLIQYVRLQAQGLSGSSTTVNTGTTVTLQATAVDTLGFTLTKPPLTWGTDNPEVASFASLNTTTGINSVSARANLGGANLTASCTPPSCNVGVLPAIPVYSSGGQLSSTNPQSGYGAISLNVTTTSKPPTYTAWAATDMCQDAAGCQSVIFSVLPGITPIGITLNVPRTPNSLMFNYKTGPRAYLGSNQGLMYFDAGSSSHGAVTTVSNSTTPCNVALCGTVKAISNDGKQVVVSDDVSATPQVYIYNGSTQGITDLVLPSVVQSASFSPDQSKIFLLTNANTLFVYSTVDALGQVPAVTSGTDVGFSADGSFAYVAASSGGSGSVSAYSMCSVAGAPTVELANSPVATAGIPLRIFPSPNIQATTDFITQSVYALEPPNVQVLTAQFTQNPVVYDKDFCVPPSLFSFTAGSVYNLGQGTFIPLYSRLVANGSQIIIVAKKNPSVLIFNIANGTTTSVPLVNNGDPLAASSSTDGGQVYVAACDQYNTANPPACIAGSVHIVNTVTQGDFQQVPFINNGTNNMCNNVGQNAPLCVADMIAIQPQ
jgi:hypothetical protein